jgi:hypothetical protein
LRLCGQKLINFDTGYDAVEKREEIGAFQSIEDYIEELQKSLGQIEITGYELENLQDFEKSVVRKLDVEIRAFDLKSANFLFNPFFFDKWSENPFKSRERLYPVDFGVPLERITVFNLEYPPDFEVVNIPERVGLSLPNEGGRFLLEAQNNGNKLSLNNLLSIRKAVYSPSEYHYLKELFSRIIQVQNGELIFRKKT